MTGIARLPVSAYVVGARIRLFHLYSQRKLTKKEYEHVDELLEVIWQRTKKQ